MRIRALGLATLPHGFPLIPRYERLGIRWRSWRGYDILYRVADEGIVILRLGRGRIMTGCSDWVWSERCMSTYRHV